MKLKDNFSEILLLSEQPVIFSCDDPYLIKTIKITMKILPISLTLTDPFVQYSLAIFNLTAQDIEDRLKQVGCSTKWDFLLKLREQNTDPISRNLIYYFQLCFGTQFDAQNWKINGIEIDEQLYSRIEDIALISAGIKKFNEQQIFNKDKPAWLIEQENKIKRIKNQNKQQNVNAFAQMSKTLISINHEFGYSFEEVFDMNYFHMQHLANYVPKAIAFDIQKRQVLSKKKIKYITDK